MLCAALLAAGALVFAALSGPAEAAYPGKNGKIAFVSERDGDDEIYVMKAAPESGANQPLRLTDNSLSDREPAFSPDGSRIAFRRISGAGNFDIWTMNADGTGQRKLTSGQAVEADPTWSPDGTRIAFCKDGAIHIMDADGKNQKPLTDPGFAFDREPAWSPDGVEIAFTSDRDSPLGGSDIYVIDANAPESPSNPARQLTEDADNNPQDDTDEAPAWSPEGSRIAFETDRGGDFNQIWVMDADGTDQESLTANPKTYGRQPAWSPDGSKVALANHKDNGDLETFVINADGTGGTYLTDNQTGDDEDPDWQPLPQCTKIGTAGDDTLVGTAGKDVLCGLGGKDTINGMGGDDIALGGAGDDRLVGSPGNDTLNGATGTDAVVYSGSATAIRASLATGFARGQGSDALLGVEDLTGSKLADVVTGSGAANVLLGLGGSDTLRAGSGDDRVVGGVGADRLLGEGGDDRLDSRDGVNGNDSLRGGPGTDTCAKDATEASVLGCP